MASPDRYIWHHQLHEAWASERLYFWRLAFFPTYDQTAIRDGVEEVLTEHGVASYALYEIYGVYDLILRIWLPTQTSPERFEEALESRLKALHMEVCDAFSVGQILRHWPWPQKDGTVMPIDSGVVRDRMREDALADLNEIARGGRSVSSDEDALKTALSKKILAPCNLGDGLKFFVVVTSSSQLATIAARSALRQRLNEILDEAEEEGAVSDTSLYEGSGFGQFIMLGRIDPTQFSALRIGVIDRVNAAGMGPYFRARPYTYLTATGAGEDGLAPKFVDVMPTLRDSADASEPIEAFLERDESEELEMKGSAFVNVDRWIQSGKAVRDEDVTNEGVLKSIVGMLNRLGGTVVLGVLETSRYDSEKLAKRRSGEFPVVGQYVCVGVELDYQGKDWDHYALKLQRIIMERIDPPPVGLVTISRVEVAGKPLCVLAVQRTSREWFYLNREKGAAAEFYVRLGNGTRDLRGPVADGYKQSYPRG